MKSSITTLIRNQIAQSNIQEALQLFDANLDKNSKAYNIFIVAKSDWKETITANMRNTISRDEYRRELAQISTRLLQLLELVERNDSLIAPVVISEILKQPSTSKLVMIGLPFVLVSGAWAYKQWYSDKNSMVQPPIVKEKDASQPESILQPVKKKSNLPQSFEKREETLPLVEKGVASPTPVVVKEVSLKPNLGTKTAAVIMSYDKANIPNASIPKSMYQAITNLLTSDYPLRIKNTSDDRYIKSDGIVAVIQKIEDIDAIYKKMNLSPDKTELILLVSLKRNFNEGEYQLDYNITQWDNAELICSASAFFPQDTIEANANPAKLQPFLSKFLGEKLIGCLSKSNAESTHKQDGYDILLPLPSKLQGLPVTVSLNDARLKQVKRNTISLQFRALSGKHHVEICNEAATICCCMNFIASKDGQPPFNEVKCH